MDLRSRKLPCPSQVRKAVRPRRSRSRLGNAEDVQEPVLNPMMNPVVLTRFFELCDPGDLRRFRLVCKSWHDLLLPRWRREEIIYLQNYSSFIPQPDETIVIQPKARKRLTVETLKLLYETPSVVDKPYAKYRFDDWQLGSSVLNYFNFCERDRGNDEALPKLESPAYHMAMFWQNCGSWIRYLHLHALTVYCPEGMRKVLFEWTPNLQTLHLTRMNMIYPVITIPGLDFDPELRINTNLKVIEINFVEESRIPFTWKQLFHYFPEMEEIHLSGKFVDLAIHTFVKTVEELGREKRLMNLKSLNLKDLYHTPSPDLMTRIFQLDNLRLESFSFNKRHDYPELTLVPSIIQRQVNTLKSIDLFQCAYSHRVRGNDQIPYSILFNADLIHLTKLQLSSSITDNLDFLKFTPNLEELCIRGYQDGTELETGIGRLLTSQNLQKLEGLRLQHLRKLWLRISDNHFKLHLENIARLATIMPDVKELCIPVNNEGFRAVCDVWNELRMLSIWSPELDDEGLTGIMSSSPRNSRLPNITNLKYLHTLTISSEVLTDVSIHQGFLMLPFLTKLSVTMSANTSNEAIKALCKKFPSLRIRRDKQAEGDRKAIKSQAMVDYHIQKKAKMVYKEYGIL